MSENQGELHAFDLHPHKIPLIEASCRRLGVDIVRAKAGDSALLGESYREWADYVLLDAPCSGLGVLSERADSRHLKQPHQVQELAKLSYRLLTAASDYVKPGGWLCYSTCTITKQENDNNVERFLAAHKEFKPAPMEKLAAMLEQPEQQQAAREGRIQLMPFDWGTEGFFISLMKKEY